MKRHLTKGGERLVLELSEIADEIDGGLLHVASPGARTEWLVFRTRWPSAANSRCGSGPWRDDDVAFLVDKARRFRDILAAASAEMPVVAPTHAAA
jgi:hypothetical protein